MKKALPVRSHPARLRAAALVAACLASFACVTTPAPAPEASHAIAGYRVGPPDLLGVRILPEPLIEHEAVVRPDGMITIDLIGDVAAQGRTLTEIATDIETRMGRFKRGAIATVALRSALSTAVTVLGEVRGPRSFPLVKPTRLSDAIGIVGGTTLFAATSRIRVIRPGDGETAVFTADLAAIQAGDLRTNIELSSGDLVYVPPSAWARVGYAIQAMLFPLQPLIGLGTSVAGSTLGGRF